MIPVNITLPQLTVGGFPVAEGVEVVAYVDSHGVLLDIETDITTWDIVDGQRRLRSVTKSVMKHPGASGAAIEAEVRRYLVTPQGWDAVNDALAEWDADRSARIGDARSARHGE